MGSKDKRIESWERKFSNELSIDSAKPNIGHVKLAEIMNKKEEAHLITQNVDNLHQDSGIDDSKITELHGNATYAKCLNCYARYELSPLKKDFLATKEPPLCTICGGIIKTATISFGQAMPEEEMITAQPMDSVILLGGCDKNIPALLMGSFSTNVPSVLMVPGPMMTGMYNNERVGACTDCRRYWSQFRSNEISKKEIIINLFHLNY